MQTFPEQLRAARESAGLSQKAAAALLGISRTTLYLWESGKGAPAMELLAKAAVDRLQDVCRDRARAKIAEGQRELASVGVENAPKAILEPMQAGPVGEGEA